MKRILGLMLFAGTAVAVGAAVCVRGKRRKAADAAADLALDIERFENEGGSLAPR